MSQGNQQPQVPALSPQQTQAALMMGMNAQQYQQWLQGQQSTLGPLMGAAGNPAPMHGLGAQLGQQALNPVHPGKILLVDDPALYPLMIIGRYTVLRHDVGGSACSLYNTENMSSPIVSWRELPSRSAIAMAIRDHRARRPRKNARDEFGTLIGVRLFALSEDLHLKSPSQGTIWQSAMLTVDHPWDESEVVRGAAGIHAAWPSMSERCSPFIDAISNHPSYIMGYVRGMGRFVAGETGWRAEKVIIDRIFLPAAIKHRWRYLKRLERLYPEVSFEEEPWTLERSSRLAKSSQTSSR